MKFIIILKFVFITVFSQTVIAQEIGKASFYNNKFKGRKTADGTKYHPDSLICAHRTLPFGTWVLVRNLSNNNSVVLKVTDRGPHTRNRIIDVSFSAAQSLDFVRKGITTVEVITLDELKEKFQIIPFKKTYLDVNYRYPVDVLKL